MTDWFCFEILVGADLLPSTGFNVSDVLCYKPIPIIYRTLLLQNSLKVIITRDHFIKSGEWRNYQRLTLRLVKDELWVYIYSWWKPQCWFKAPDISSIFKGFFCSSDVYTCESGTFRSLPFFLTIFINVIYLWLTAPKGITQNGEITKK